MLERDFQAALIRELTERFPRSIILKNDANYIQGFPDILILHGKAWAALEVKQSGYAPFRPNQQWYLEKLDGMSFAAVIYPEIKDEVLNKLYDYISSINNS